MNKQKKLQAIIEYAKKQGLDVEMSGTGSVKFFYGKDETDKILRPIEAIFDHDFAKAVFGEEENKLNKCPKCGYSKEYSKHDEALFCPNDGRKLKESMGIPWDQKWKDRLQEAVIREDPIDYYYQHIKRK